MFFQSINRLVSILFLTVIAVTGCSGEGSKNGSSLDGFGSTPPALSTVADPSLNVLVIGGTSGIGLEIVRQSAERGHNVTALARRPERMSFFHQQLTVLKGDVLDVESITDAISQNDIIISTIGMGPTRDPVNVFSEGMKNTLAIMTASNKSRLITVTGIGAGDSNGHGGFFYDKVMLPWMLKTIYDDKNIQEALVRKGATDWTIVRPGFLIDDPAEHRYYVLEDLHGVKSGDISRADVAHFIIGAFEQGLYVKKTVFLTN
ncbi:MAG: SDR family NAD(P)-dependent oxidoreductase [Oceanicoccus sp.]